jgi:hypothetical protein
MRSGRLLFELWPMLSLGVVRDERFRGSGLTSQAGVGVV